MAEVFNPSLYGHPVLDYNFRTISRILYNITTGEGIPTTRITDDAIDGTKIADASVDTEHIVADAVTAAKIEALTITAAEIAAGAIITAKIAAGAITADEIASNAVTTAKILANAVTAAKIAANTITANEILANTITAAKIAANTITASEIAASTITATELNVSQLDAISANVGTLTAGTITSALTVNSLWRLVDTWTCGTAATSHSFTGLTGDTAIEYMIKCRWVRYRDGAADPMNYILCCNDDTATNYGFTTNWTVNGADGGSEDANFDGIWLGRADENGEISQGQGILHAISGYTRTFSGQFSASVNGKDIERIYNCECSWNNTADEITSLVFYAETASGIGVGSQIDIYERVA